MTHLLTIPVQKKIPKDIEGADALEFWLDSFENPEKVFEQWKRFRQKKIVAVCKNQQEQGCFMGSDKKKIDLLLSSVRAGADYVDVGLHTEKNEIRRLKKFCKKTKLIISFHDFKKTPDRKILMEKIKKMKELGADVIKIATMVNDLSDNELLIELALELKAEKKPHIIIGMGEKGKITRVFSEKMGNEMTFASGKIKTAEGQFNVQQMLQIKNLMTSIRL